MTYNAHEQAQIDKANAKLKKFSIKYFYCASGHEDGADVWPEKIIEAPSKDMAVYIYQLMFEISKRSFEKFNAESDVYKYWGLTIKEL